MKIYAVLFIMPSLLFLFISCSSTRHGSGHSVTTSDIRDSASFQALRDIKEYQIDDTIAKRMINYFKICKDTACKDSRNSTDDDGVLSKIRHAYPNILKIESILARFQDNDEERYCTTRKLQRGSEACKVANYSIEILKVTAKTLSLAKTTTYYSYKKICPPPATCK